MSDLTLELLERGDNYRAAIGSFWNEVHNDQQFLKALFRGHGLINRQTVEDLRRAADCLNRNTIPTTRNRLVRQFTLTVAEANRGKRLHRPFYGEDGLTFGMDSFVYGGNVESGYFEYEIETDIQSVATLSDNLTTPELVMTQNAEFDTVAIDGRPTVLRFKDDPFDGRFPNVKTLQKDGETFLTLALWGTDVEYADNAIADFFGTPLGVHDARDRGESYKAFVNACWDIIQLGPSVGRTRRLFAAACGVPVVKSDNETVVSVVTTDDDTWVVTTAQAYRLGASAEGTPAVGTVLDAGDFLSLDIRMFDLAELRDMSSDDIAELIPGLGLPVTLVTPVIAAPLVVSAGAHAVTAALTNGHPTARVTTATIGHEDDVEAFWDYADEQFPGFHQVLTGSGTKPLPSTFDLLKYMLTEVFGPDGTLCTLNISNLDQMDYTRLGWLRKLYPPGRALIISIVTAAPEDVDSGAEDDPEPPAEYIQDDTPSDASDDVIGEPEIEPGSFET